MLFNEMQFEDDPMRRRVAASQGMAGPQQSLGRLFPFIRGVPTPNLAGVPSGSPPPAAMPMNMGVAGPMGHPNVAPASPSGYGVSQPPTAPGGPVIFNPNSGPNLSGSGGNRKPVDGRMPGNPTMKPPMLPPVMGSR